MSRFNNVQSTASEPFLLSRSQGLRSPRSLPPAYSTNTPDTFALVESCLCLVRPCQSAGQAPGSKRLPYYLRLRSSLAPRQGQCQHWKSSLEEMMPVIDILDHRNALDDRGWMGGYLSRASDSSRVGMQETWTTLLSQISMSTVPL